ncbi:ABC transporter permease subunit [Kocuria indica]|uniref:ABC transporter permease subunit n=1 Tax=Kocuria marina subsp. indica TaxID=1049583 RepID=A0A6N9QZL5_9MICC|nr:MULTISPECIES: carbohydrate ABC transporter permease [Kocuria]MCT1617325.1 carbohydrate ABC transporter permease [Kocuria marina]NDO78087.1 ABC transporter permease subunit [Kocuria indica]
MRTAARVAICTIITVIMVFPLYAMVRMAFSTRSELFAGDILIPDSWTLANFQNLFEKYPMGTWVMNSVAVSLVTLVLSVTINLLAGYAFAKIPFRGRSILFILVLSTLMIPAQAIMIPQFRIVSELGIYGTFWGVILPSAATALGIFLARQFFLSIPDELLEAARLDGAGQLRIFFSIVLPLARPLVAVMVLLAFMNTWNDFLWPLIVLKDPELYTLPVSLRFLQGEFSNDYGGLMAAGLISCVPLVVLFLLLQKWFVQGIARTGIR